MVWITGACLAALPSQAVEIVTLSFDSTASSITLFDFDTPVIGPHPLTGSITIEFDALPSPTSFRILELTATGTDTSLSLWEFAPLPSGLAGVSDGLGLLNFTEFLVLDGVIPAVPGPGTQVFNLGLKPFGGFTVDAGGNVRTVAIPFDFEGEFPSMWEIRFVAVPEPNAALLAAVALVALAWRERRELSG